LTRYRLSLERTTDEWSDLKPIRDIDPAIRACLQSGKAGCHPDSVWIWREARCHPLFVSTTEVFRLSRRAVILWELKCVTCWLFQ